jgi:hypothetical protein
MRAPQCMSPRWNWDSPTPLCPPPRIKGWAAQSPAAKGVGESQFQRLEKRLALCLLCACAPICKRLRSPGIDSEESIPPGNVAGGPVRQIRFSYRPAGLWIDSWAPEKVYKYGLCIQSLLTYVCIVSWVVHLILCVELSNIWSLWCHCWIIKEPERLKP